MPESYSLRQKLGLLCGPLMFFVVLLAPVPDGMSPEAARVAAVALLMAAFWISEALPIPVTALLPIVFFPLLGIMPAKDVGRDFGNEILFLFMGGFLIAVAMQKWQLHRRIALNVIHAFGSRADRLVLGFMVATAGLSMWISNTATAMMMVPVAAAVIDLVEAEQPSGAKGSRFGVALMLAIAYSASIGGVATLVGTPPNAIFAGMADTLFGFQISFFNWMKLGLPVSVLMLAVCWFFLTRILFSFSLDDGGGEQASQHLRRELDKLGPISHEERCVAVVFFLVAAAWILRGLFKPDFIAMVSDPAIAMAGAVVLFLLPASGRHHHGRGGFVLDWQTAVTIPWDIIILMGGGFALAGGFSETGLTEWLANQLNVLAGVHFMIIILTVVLMVTFLTEVTSNAATASLFIPVMGALALSMGLHPYTLMVPATIAASMAFMLPVATPPNAIIFSSRKVSIMQMAKAGFFLNILGGLLVSGLSYVLLPLLR